MAPLRLTIPMRSRNPASAAAPAPARNAAPLPLAVPVEPVERKIPSTTGNLSQDTLKALLTVQEEEGTNE
jgi:hypothetical protein